MTILRKSFVALLLLWVILVSMSFAQTIEPQYGDSVEVVNAAAVTELKAGWIVTAVCDVNSNLSLIVWNDTGAALVKKGSYTSTRTCLIYDTQFRGYSQLVGITTLNSSTVVTIDINAVTLDTEVSAWHVSATGAINPIGTTAAVNNNAETVSIAKLDSTRVVTAIVDFTGSASNLEVDTWEVPASGVVKELSSALQTGLTFAFSAIAVLNSGQAITASLQGPGLTYDLQLTNWLINGAGAVFEAGTLVSAGASQLAIARLNSSTFLTAISDSTGNLELASWEIVNGTFFQKAIGKGGTASIPLVSIIPSTTLPFVAVDNSSGNLAAQVWKTSGSAWNELTGSSTTQASMPAGTAGIGKNKIVSAATKTTNGELQLEVWLYTP